jgi:GNAT superfamily N-acetyltransferase
MLASVDEVVHIRRAEVADWQAVRAARLTALADSPLAFGSTIEREMDFDDQEWQRWITSGDVFLAWLGWQPVGIVASVRSPDQQDEAHLVAMWVAADHRGTSVATDLVEAVCGWARLQGAQLVTLWVADGNPRARRFYERLGFRPTGQRKALPSSPEIGEDLMERLICP